MSLRLSTRPWDTQVVGLFVGRRHVQPLTTVRLNWSPSQQATSSLICYVCPRKQSWTHKAAIVTPSPHSFVHSYEASLTVTGQLGHAPNQRDGKNASSLMTCAISAVQDQ